MFEIIEDFLTISGEQPIIGHPIYLIRFSGCNLNCNWCDTDYKNEVNKTLSIDDLKSTILEKIKSYQGLKVLLTGGEPLLDNRKDKLIQIIKALSQVDFFIETNGTINISNLDIPNCRLILDWKPPSSGQKDNFHPDNINLINAQKDCIKFVVEKTDLEWVLKKYKFIRNINRRIPIYISPVQDKASYNEISDFIIKNKLNIGMNLQLHKIIWGNVRGV